MYVHGKKNPLNLILNNSRDPFVARKTKALTVYILFHGSIHKTFLGALLHALPLLPNLTALSINYATYHIATFFQTITLPGEEATTIVINGICGNVRLDSGVLYTQYTIRELDQVESGAAT